MKRRPPTDIPADFSISERVRAWAAAKKYDRLDEHFDYFVLRCQSLGYQYVNWDSALMVAIRDDWAKVRSGHITVQQNVTCARCHGSLSAGFTKRREGPVCNQCEEK